MGTITLNPRGIARFFGAKNKVRMAKCEAVVYPACATCHTPNPTGSVRCLDCGALTPKPRRLGTIAYYHRNPVRRLMHRLAQQLGVIS